MKLGTACLQCRQKMRKCDKSMPGTACEQCQRRRIQCSSSRRVSTTPADLFPLAASDSKPTDCCPLPSTEVLSELINLYIDYIHDKPHTLFHAPSLRQAALDGTASRTVLFGICGLSARFSTEQTIRSLGHVWSAEAMRLCKQNLENVCIENIQACILVGNICLAESNPDSESLFFVIANRMAQLLNLAKENSEDDAVLREVNRRIWWSLYLIDRWASAGLGLPRQFHIGGLAPNLPMDEVMFLGLSSGESSNSNSVVNWKPGIWSHMISLVNIFEHIQDLHKELVDRVHWDEEYIESRVLSLAEELAAFERNLPSNKAFSLENLELHKRRGVGRTFVALHLGYHHYSTLLYYQYLDQRRPANPNTKMFTHRCKHHAIAYYALIQTAIQHGQEALHNILGHMTVVSSSVLLHTLLLGDDDELPEARQRLESNFEFLVRLKDIWPSVELMMKRLITFQNACLSTARLGTHRFDKWMVKFLLQYALALDEIDDPQAFAGTNLQNHDERLVERSRVTETIIQAPQSSIRNPYSG